MKKRSLFIVVAMVLLLAVVLGMGGTTFAKYITTATPLSTTATVAKWGYTATITSTELFGNDYTANEVVADGTGLEVRALSNDTLAPGTTGDFTVAIAGKAEVLSKITFTMSKTSDVFLATDDGQTRADGTAFTNVLTDDYYPVVWKVVGHTKIDTPALDTDTDPVAVNQTFTTLQDLVDWVNGNNSSLASIAPNTDVAINWTISWTWAFTGQNDDADTKLGDIVANPALNVNDSSVQIGFDLGIVVEQIEG